MAKKSLSCLPLQILSTLYTQSHTYTVCRGEATKTQILSRRAQSASKIFAPKSVLSFHILICRKISSQVDSANLANSMDGLDPGKVKKIIWKRSKTQPEVNHEREGPNKCQDEGEKRHPGDSLELSTSPRTCNLNHPFLMPLLPIPKLEEWCLNSSIFLTGTACRGVTGPPVGAVDVGVSKSAYYFCIALPGVKKDPGEFSCEIRRDGKVCVLGLTSTGGKIVSKYSRVFVMKLQQQCPPGPFKLFFSLPGPIDPRLFSANFRSDGIFEGVVAKYE